MPNKIKIQLAIQGGGAKIVAIMAVLQAFEELEDRIEVTKIVGTSAGAIAGALYASGFGIKRIVAGWSKGELDPMISSLTIPKYRLLPKVLGTALHLTKRSPIWSSDSLHKYLDSIFKSSESGISTFADLKKKKGTSVVVISTNLRNRSTEESNLGSPVIATLLDSAGLPFLLRKWGEGGSAVIVDGGIGENLPAARLNITNEGEIAVCISFKPRVNAGSNPSGFIDFSLALLDTAIDASSARSASLVPHTFFIDSPITTFDFKKAIKGITDGSYVGIKDDAHNWLTAICDDIKTKEDQKATAFSVTELHPWQSTNPVAQAVMTGVWKAIELQFGHSAFQFDYVEIRARLDSLKLTGKPDEIKFSMDFQVSDELLYSYSLGVSDGIEAKLQKEPVLEIYSIDDGQPVPHIRVPGVSPNDPGSRFTIIFFTPPLTKGRAYRLVHTEVGLGLFEPLKSGRDDLGFMPSRVKGSIRKARIVIDIADSVERCTLKFKPDITAQSLREVLPQNVPMLDNIPLLLEYKSHVFEGTEVEGGFGVDIAV